MAISMKRAPLRAVAPKMAPRVGHSAAHRVFGALSAIAAWLGARSGLAMFSIARTAARNISLAITIALLAALCGLQALALLRAPAAWLPSAITINLAAGDAIILGQRELGAPQTDRNHLSLRRDAQGQWMLRNLSASKQVVLMRDLAEQRMGSADLQPHQRFQIDGAVFDVQSADARIATFTRDGHEWRYDGATLYRDGSPQANCPESHLAAKALAVWNRAMPLALAIARPLSFGGNLYCDNRLGLAQVTPGAAQLARVNGRLQISAGSPDGDRAAVMVADASGARNDLRKQEAALAGVTAILVGRTRFQVSTSGDQMTLGPSRHVKLFNEPDLRLPEQVSWQWQQRALWGDAGHSGAIWIGIAACLACLAVTTSGALGARRIGRAVALLGTTALLAAGLFALISQRAGYAPSAACSLVLGASALLVWLALPGRLTLMTAGVVLLAAGLLAQLELGLGAWNHPGCATTRKAPRCWPSAPDGAPAAAVGGRARGVMPHAARHRMDARAVRLRRLAALAAAGTVGRRNRRVRPAAGGTGQARADRADRPLPRPRASAGTRRFRSAHASRRALVAAGRARAAVPRPAWPGTGAGGRLLAPDPAAGVEHGDGVRLRRWRRANTACGRGHGGCLRCRGGHRLAAQCRRRRGDRWTSTPTASWSGWTRPAIRTPASNCCSARAPSPRAAGGAPTSCWACSSLGQSAGSALQIPPCRTTSRLVLPEPPRPAGRPCAVDAQALFLVGVLQTARAPTPPAAKRAISAMPGWAASAASPCAAAPPSCSATSCSRGAPTWRSSRSWASP
jgi:hypothetical protein